LAHLDRKKKKSMCSNIVLKNVIIKYSEFIKNDFIGNWLTKTRNFMPASCCPCPKELEELEDLKTINY